MTARRRTHDARAALLEHCAVRRPPKWNVIGWTAHDRTTRRLLNRLLRQEREASGKDAAVRALEWIRQAGILSATDEQIERWALRAAVLRGAPKRGGKK